MPDMHSAEIDAHATTYADLVEAGWTDVATLRQKIEQTRIDALADLLTEIEDDPIRWQHGGGANTGALVVTNIVKRRLKEGPREHGVVRTHNQFWWCDCSPEKARPFGYDEGHDRLARAIPPGSPDASEGK